MSATWKPLPIWCGDGDELDMDRLRTAKDGLWLDYLVKPVTAEPSMESRVLAWGSLPPYLCAYALVDPRGTDEELAEAMAWVLHEGECSVAVEYEHFVAALFGPGTQEVPAAQLEAEQKLADYEKGA